MNAPFPELPDQRGFATSRQLRGTGWTVEAIRHLVTTRGRRVFPNVLIDHRGQLSTEDRVCAAWLWAGPDAVLTGCSALTRHGMEPPRAPGVLRFLVPFSARTRAFGGAQTVRTRRPDRPRPLGGIPTASIERALADAARYGELTASEARSLTISALQRRLTTVERIEAEVIATRRNGLTGVRAGVQEHRRGAWSIPEATLIQLIAHHPGLPPMLANPRLLTPDGQFVGIPDGYFPDEGVAVQVHSLAHHSGSDAAGRDLWARTVEADADFERHGVVVVAVAPTTLDRDPSGFLRTLREVLAAHRGRPAPDVLIEPFAPSGR